jgi:hypothetical protein
MAYNKVSNKFQSKDVKYLNKDFDSYKNQLIEFAKTYFPQNFNDFSEGNPGMMFLEMAAYVGDVLSFYTDTQMQETFLSLAQDRENLYNMAHAMGYKPKVTTAASVDLEISQLVPSKMLDGAYVPDYDYATVIMANATFTSTDGPTFYTTRDCDFTYSSSFGQTTSSIYQYDSSMNPEYYILTKTVPAISGEVRSQNITIGSATKFKTITLFDTDIIAIDSITDGEGNEWSEVDFLAQDTIFEKVPNNEANDPSLSQYSHQTPYLLKTKQVPRRFISRVKPNNRIEIQFGAGTSTQSDELIVPNPDNIGLGIKDGRNKLDTFYDPSNFLHTKAYGQAPANTTLNIKYIAGGGLGANVNSNTIVNKETLQVNFKPNLVSSMKNFINSSITVTNPKAARGGSDGDSIEDIRLNTMANFSTQGRTITREDYIIRALSMPPQFGSVAKAYIVQDDQIALNPGSYSLEHRIPNPLAMNLYVMGYNSSKELATLNTATKTNLATYLEEFRTLTDAINIKDAFVINIAIDFEVTAFKNYNNQSVILDCINELKSYFNIDKWQINQPIIITDIKNVIGGVKGVQTVESVTFSNKSGALSGYSQYKYPLDTATKNEVIYPSLDPSIFELKYPNTDIKGRVTTY